VSNFGRVVAKGVKKQDDGWCTSLANDDRPWPVLLGGESRRSERLPFLPPSNRAEVRLHDELPKSMRNLSAAGNLSLMRKIYSTFDDLSNFSFFSDGFAADSARHYEQGGQGAIRLEVPPAIHGLTWDFSV
jgi:hypothetical protein